MELTSGCVGSLWPISVCHRSIFASLRTGGHCVAHILASGDEERARATHTDNESEVKPRGGIHGETLKDRR